MPLPIPRPTPLASSSPLPRLPDLPVIDPVAALGPVGPVGPVGGAGAVGGVGSVGGVGGVGGIGPAGGVGPMGSTGGAGGAPAVAEAGIAAPHTGSEFVSARSPRPGIVHYQRADGSRRTRDGGSRAWRNNNPGNIVAGSFASSQGAIGTDGRFAIFPTRDHGADAVKTLLEGPSYRDLTLAAAIDRYAPPSENDTEGYVDFVVAETELKASDVLRDLKAAEIRAIVKAITRIEGWREGRETEESGQPAPSVAPGGVAPVSAAAAAGDWMAIAKREAALPAIERSEWSNAAAPGMQDNPRILAYLNSCDLMGANWAIRDETEWCAGFVNFCLEDAGFTGTDHPGARSFFWNRRNQFVRLAQPQFGAIAVLRDAPFDDPTWETGTGHVGFVISWTETHVTLLGGNQSNTVREAAHPIRQVSASGQVRRRLEAVMMPRMN